MGVQTILSDSFAGADDAALAGRTPDTVNMPGGTWADTAAAFKIKTNAARPQNGTSDVATIYTGYTDGVIRARIRSAVQGQLGVLFRSDGTLNNYWRGAVDIGYAPGVGGIRVVKRVGGVNQGMVFVAHQLLLNTWYDLVFTVAGNVFTTDCDGASASWTEATLNTNLYAGLYAGQAGDVGFDSFSVEADVPDSVAISAPALSTTHLRTITVSGTYSGGPPTAIEARLGTRDWVVIDPAPAGGTWSGVYPYTHPATGTLSVRWANNTAITAAVTGVTVTSHSPIPAGITGGGPSTRRRAR